MKQVKFWIAALILVVLVTITGLFWSTQQSGQHTPLLKPTTTAPNTTQKPGERKILYYRNPMGLPDTSPVPKQDEMGMDYLPVYADEESASHQIHINTDKLQKLGVQTDLATTRDLIKTVRATARLQVDERKQYTIAPRFEGYIEKLYVNATGQPVQRGQALMAVYSPELVSAQEEYLIAWRGSQTMQQGTEESRQGVTRLAQSALKRLQNWGISDAQLQRLQQEGRTSRTMVVYAPASGVVMEKTAVQGMRFMPGEALFNITDLSSLWLIADIFEQDLAQIQLEQQAVITIAAYPGQTFRGRVSYIYPTLSPETRTAAIRIEMNNSGGLLKPEMYAQVQLMTHPRTTPVLTIPDSAVLDSGTRKIVLVQRETGVFEPREVHLGQRYDDYVEVIQGLTTGERVVIRANFLIDAESNLKAALSGFGTAENLPATSHAGH